MASIADMLDIRRQKAWDDYHAEMFAESTYTQQARQAADALSLAPVSYTHLTLPPSDLV